MSKYQSDKKGQEVALRETMRRDAAYCRREAALQDQLKGRGRVLSTQQFITDPAARRDDYMAVPYAVARVRR
jgi:hypothetical protein